MKYNINLKLNNEEIKSKGDTLVEALENLVLPMFVKTKAIMNVKFGDKETNRVVTAFQLKRVRAKGAYKNILAKNLELFLK